MSNRRALVLVLVVIAVLVSPILFDIGSQIARAEEPMQAHTQDNLKWVMPTSTTQTRSAQSPSGNTYGMPYSLVWNVRFGEAQDAPAEGRKSYSEIAVSGDTKLDYWATMSNGQVFRELGFAISSFSRRTWITNSSNTVNPTYYDISLPGRYSFAWVSWYPSGCWQGLEFFLNYSRASITSGFIINKTGSGMYASQDGDHWQWLEPGQQYKFEAPDGYIRVENTTTGQICGSVSWSLVNQSERPTS